MTNIDDPSQSFVDENEAWLLDRIERARSGDESALGELMAFYRNYLLQIAKADMGQQLNGKVSASDVVQESLVKVGQNIERFRGQSISEFKIWIRRIILNKANDARRIHLGAKSRDARREHRIGDSAMPIPQLQDVQPTPFTELALKEKTVLVRQLLDSLSEKDAEVIRLRNWQAMTFEQIGEQMEMTADAARKLWYRAVIRLQKLIEQSCPALNEFDTDTF